MRYVVTRDHGSVAIWPIETEPTLYLEKDNDSLGSLWMDENAGEPVFEMQYVDFRELYKRDIPNNSKHVVDIVVHMITEEE